MTETERVEARLIEVGDLIEWVSRVVQVTAIEHVRPRGSGTQKPGRRFTVYNKEIGEVSGLHWFYNEAVRKVAL